MTVGALRIELFISDANSLKQKRSVIKALKDRIRNNFNVAVSEVAEQDKWQRAVIGIAAVGTDRKFVNTSLDKVLDLVRQNRSTDIINSEMEIL